MKVIIAFLCIGLVFACAKQKNPQEEASLILANLRAKDVEVEKADRKKRSAESERILGKEINLFSKRFGLTDLQNQNFQEDDLEIRILKKSAFNDKDITFQLSKNKGKWSAKLIEKVLAKKNLSKNNPPEKLFSKNLQEPEAGWSNFYQKLAKEQILTLPNGDAVGNEPSFDDWIYIIEIKTSEKYRIYAYNAPENDSKTPESQQMVKIINLISQEFDLNVFNGENFQAP